MAAAKYARIVSTNLDSTARKIDDWSTRGVSEAIRQGMDEYGHRLGIAAYASMKLPTVGPNSPWYVGLRWRRTRQIHSKPQQTKRAGEWEIRIAPQYLALWQEAGVKPHLLFNPDKMRGRSFMRFSVTQRKRRMTIASLKSKTTLTAKERSKLQRNERSERKLTTSLAQLQGARGTAAVIGYSDPSEISAKHKGSDWFKGRTPVETAGKRAGQPRPTMVSAGTEIRHPGLRATRPILRGAQNISGMHRQRMAALMKQAYDRRGR